jgi:type I restriction enzyme S subunit
MDATVYPRAFAVWWSDLEPWIIPSSRFLRRSLPADWTRIRIGELVSQVTTRVRVDPESEYKMAGVKWYGEGIFHRETVRGNEMSATQVTPLVPGALIYNRLFAWKASFAAVTPEFADCYVSNEFPQFVPDADRILPEYLYLFFTRAPTIRAVNAASTGSAAVSRNRFREEQFLDFEIPLPPLAEQSTIVARWQKAKDQISGAMQRIQLQRSTTEARFLADLGLRAATRQQQPRAFAVWWKDTFGLSVRATFLSVSNASLKLGKYPVVRGHDCLLEVRHGSSASPSPKPTALEVLKLSAVTRGIFDPSEKKYAFDDARVREEFALRKGDVLMCRTNGTLAYVGMSAIVPEDMPHLVFPDKIIRARTNETILPEYLWQVLQSHPVRAQIEAAARTAVGNYAIGTEDIWNLQIPLPPLDVQAQIMQRVAAGHKEVAREKEDADRLALAIVQEVEALILGTKRVGAL